MTEQERALGAPAAGSALLTVGSLFSGIGGIDLGLERAGMRVVWQCESNPYARAVLRKHWPGVPCYEDVSRLRPASLASVDFLCGGFPCQDISAASPTATGIAGERSGLWFHYARLLSALRPPAGALIECTPPWKRWLPSVRRHLWAAGYASLPIQLSAADLGAPHLRKRIFVVAHPDSERLPRDWANRMGEEAALGVEAGDSVERGGWWASEPDVVRVVHGIPRRMDRIRCLGNAVVPQVAEYIGRCILRASQSEPPKAPQKALEISKAPTPSDSKG